MDAGGDRGGGRPAIAGSTEARLADYAAATATSAAYERIRDAATSGDGDKPSRSATAPFADMLERLYVLEPLPGWVPTRNQLAKLTTGPKHHLADPAWATALLGLDDDALLEGRQSGMPVPRDGTLLGGLFESLMALCLRVYAQTSDAAVFHLRTHQGLSEVDFVVARRDGRVVALEAKLARTANDHDLRHLRWLSQQIGPDLLDAAVITTGPYAYRRPDDNIAVIPAALLGPRQKRLRLRHRRAPSVSEVLIGRMRVPFAQQIVGSSRFFGMTVG